MSHYLRILPGAGAPVGSASPLPRSAGADDLGFRLAAGAGAEQREPEGPYRADRRGEIGRGGLEAVEDEAPARRPEDAGARRQGLRDRKSTRLNSSHRCISYA